jgi:glycosyltransferase involved in cell wall biosynthesis
MAARKVASMLATMPERNRVLFAYSYAVSRAFDVGAERGCRTVKGQIDGGPAEEEIVLAEQARFPALRDRYSAAPPRYWREWREQCAKADKLLVNSPWAQSCMRNAGVDPEKLVVVPLYFESNRHSVGRKLLPERFSASRPMRALFLGQVNLRKGAARLFDAMLALKGEPIEFWIVGPVYVDIPGSVRALSNARIIGPVARDAVAEHYERADVFLLPTLSDAFALTQLEAQAYGLPIVASNRCGPVVKDRVNGIVLPDVNAEAIADVLRSLVASPALLQSMSDNSGGAKCALSDYGRHLASNLFK